MINDQPRDINSPRPPGSVHPVNGHDRHCMPFAEFFPPTRAIYLPGEWQLSPLWQGLILLHEGLHAFDRLVRRRHMPKPFWRREVNARLLEHRLLRSVGGPVLTQYLDKLIKEVAARWSNDTGKHVAFELSPEQATNPILDKLFGSPISRVDRDARASALKGCAVYYYFERELGQQAANKRFAAYVQEHYV